MIFRTEHHPSLPGRWILTFGDFDTEKRIINLLVTLKNKEAKGVTASAMFDRDYIRDHKKLDDIQKGILYAIIDPENNRRVLVFSGRAGSGKTTLIKALLESAKCYAEKHAPSSAQARIWKAPESPRSPGTTNRRLHGLRIHGRNY